MRLLCWVFGCNYEEEIGGGWCLRCSNGQKRHRTIYWGPIWARKPWCAKCGSHLIENFIELCYRCPRGCDQ